MTVKARSLARTERVGGDSGSSKRQNGGNGE